MKKEDHQKSKEVLDGLRTNPNQSVSNLNFGKSSNRMKSKLLPFSFICLSGELTMHKDNSIDRITITDTNGQESKPNLHLVSGGGPNQSP